MITELSAEDGRHHIRALWDARDALQAAELELTRCDASRELDTPLSKQQQVTTEPVDNMCTMCNSQTPLQCLAAESMLVCGECGGMQHYIESNMNAHGHDKVPDAPGDKYVYRRPNHFVEWLNAAQGKETRVVPDTVIDDCRRQLSRLRTSGSNVTPQTVRALLKALGHRKYYENTVQICRRLTGREPPQFDATDEEALKTMFQSIQKPFEKVRSVLCPERRNFLSYSYCMFKFCELLGLDQHLHSFALLKGRDKLHKQDMIFEGICKELDWQFISSV